MLGNYERFDQGEVSVTEHGKETERVDLLEQRTGPRSQTITLANGP